MIVLKDQLKFLESVGSSGEFFTRARSSLKSVFDFKSRHVFPSSKRELRDARNVVKYRIGIRTDLQYLRDPMEEEDLYLVT